jgi:dipeptide transport system substrate-binding protein
LQNENLRRAIGLAIDREGILTACFRGEHKEFHRALNGPYPPGSWAYNPNLPPDPYKQALAKSLAVKAREAVVGSVRLELKYPDGDPDVKAACELIAKQVAEVDKDIKIELVARDPHQLRQDVEQKHEYDLAYYHHDFADQSFWLWPLFDPRATETGGLNYLGYRDDAPLEALFRRAMGHRDPREVRRLTHEIHLRVHDLMPFIPLWQLDSHIAVRRNLAVGTFDPLQVFADVDRWTLGP